MESVTSMPNPTIFVTKALRDRTALRGCNTTTIDTEDTNDDEVR
jgi:hypothetical protein